MLVTSPTHLNPIKAEAVSMPSSDRVFILGPSHHHYLDGCAVSRCKEYSTPLGALPLDIQSESHQPVSRR